MLRSNLDLSILLSSSPGVGLIRAVTLAARDESARSECPVITTGRPNSGPHTTVTNWIDDWPPAGQTDRQLLVANSAMKTSTNADSITKLRKILRKFSCQITQGFFVVVVLFFFLFFLV